MVLQHMRRNIHRYKWVLWVVILSFIPLFGYYYTASRHEAQTAEEVVLRLDGRPITRLEVLREMEALTSVFRPTSPEQRRIILQMAKDRVIETHLWRALADRLGVQVTPDEVQAQIRQSLEMLAQQLRMQNPKLTDRELQAQVQAVFEDFLRRQGFVQYADYERAVAEQLRIQKLQNLLSGPVTVSRDEVEQAYRQQYVTARIAYVEVPLSRYKDPTPTEKDLEPFYQVHADRYRVPERRKAGYLRVDADAFLTDVFVDQTAIEKYYADHKDQFMEPERVHARHVLVSTQKRSEDEARQRAETVRARLKAGEDFAKVAREYSDDPGTREKGGDLGWFERGRMVPEFEQAAFSLAVGQVSEPIRTAYGFHIIQVLEKRPPRVRPLSEVREEIRRSLARPEAIRRARAFAEELARQVQTEKGVSLARRAQPPKAVYVETDFFAPNELRADVPAPIRDTVFSLRTPGEVRGPVALGEGTYAIVQWTGTLPPTLPPLTEVRDRVAADWKEAQKMALARKEAEELYQRALSENGDLKKAAEGAALEVKEAGPFPEAGPVGELGQASDLVRAVFQAQADTVLPPIEVPHRGVVVAKVLERKAFDPKDFEARYHQVRAQVLQQKRQALLFSVLEALKANARVETLKDARGRDRLESLM
ncbi:Peptidyl-prolyl cis-trans isomerase D [bacterium HR11]|nr:Peptidyl-prolyl cis-trans isomerase D [bacterium HR11]